MELCPGQEKESPGEVPPGLTVTYIDEWIASQRRTRLRLSDPSTKFEEFWQGEDIPLPQLRRRLTVTQLSRELSSRLNVN